MEVYYNRQRPVESDTMGKRYDSVIGIKGDFLIYIDL